MRQFLFCSLLLALLQSVHTSSCKLYAQNVSIGTSLDTLFQNCIAKKETAGVVCLISQNGKIIYEKAFGYRNVEQNLPMRKSSLFRLQSMNKVLISLAALTLVDQGKINLDEPASKYIPELNDKKVGVIKDGQLTYVPADKPITLRHVMSHSSGLGSWWNAGGLKDIYEKVESTKTSDYKEVVKAYVQLPLIDHPGNGWYYGWGTLLWQTS
ncbi:MAG: beta-lactamase family protein [Flavisolibacter sp.]|nr:beta-lactamase family protein [Flavisolibacter sp.]